MLCCLSRATLQVGLAELRSGHLVVWDWRLRAPGALIRVRTYERSPSRLVSAYRSGIANYSLHIYIHRSR